MKRMAFGCAGVLLGCLQAFAADPVVYYDAVENGRLGGGKIAINASNRMNILGAHYGQPVRKSASAGWTVETLVNNGPSSNRIDLVVLGDGYTSSELGTYRQHALNVINQFFEDPPLSTYKAYFNVHLVNVVSPESGVDNDPTLGISRNTALNMEFFCNGIERLLGIDVTLAQNAAALAPEADMILACANSTKYGGAGYSGLGIATVSGNNSSAVDVALHEFGHSFGLLADEYDYGDSERYTQAEPSEPNVSIYSSGAMQSNHAKWWYWLGANGISTFEGAYYCQYGIYRPSQNSKMRALDGAWDAVNTEILIKRVYDFCTPVDSSTPPGAYERGKRLELSFVLPLARYSVTWTVNGQTVAQNVSSLETASLNLSLRANTVAAVVTDNSTLVRNADWRNNVLSQTVNWTIHYDGSNVVPVVTKRSPAAAPAAVSEGASVAFSITADDRADPNVADRGMSNITWFVDGVLKQETKTGAPNDITSAFAFKTDAHTVQGAAFRDVAVRAAALDKQGGATEAVWTLRVNNVMAAQTIAFKALPVMALGGTNYNPGATSTSGLPVVYTSSNESVAQIANGLIRIIGAGTAVITASQPGSFDFKAAAPVTQTLTVKASLTAEIPNGGGTVTGAGLYMPGAKVALTARPAANNTFLRWEDGSQVAARNLTMPNANVLVSAFFGPTTNVPPPAITDPGPQRAMVGVLFTLPLTITSDSLPAVTVTGLPAGLSYNAPARTITGVPSAAVSNKMVTVTAKNVSKVSGTKTFAMTVLPLPVWSAGSFDGTCVMPGSGALGTAQMTVTALGKVSGKLSAGGTNYTFSAASYTNGPGFMFSAVAAAGQTKVPLAVQVTHPDSLFDGSGLAEGWLGGSVQGGASVEMWRNAWKDTGVAVLATNIAGYYTAALPGGAEYGSGYLAFTVDKAGGVKTAGRLADGTAVSLGGSLVMDSLQRVYAVLHTAPAAYKGGALFGLAQFYKASGSSPVYVRPLYGSALLWESRNPLSTGDYAVGGFSRSPGLAGGWYDTVGNLYRYYAGRELAAGTDSGAPEPELTVGTNRYDSAWWRLDGLAVTVATNKLGVMTGLTAPKAGVPVREADGYDYESATNAVGLTVSLTRATGVFKGAFKAWFDYGATHTSKSVAYEGILTPVRGDSSDGVVGRGFFLWADKATYLNLQNKPVPYSFNGSYDFLLLSDPVH